MTNNAAGAATKLFTFRTCISTAWSVVREHWFPLICATFLRELLSILAAGLVFAVFVDWKGWNLILALVVRFLAWSALQSGFLKFCLNVCENNKVNWKDLFSGFYTLAAHNFSALHRNSNSSVYKHAANVHSKRPIIA
jgi:hypothetical protein